MTLKPLCVLAFITALLNFGTLNLLTAQNSNQGVIDSLIAELSNAEPDTNKVNLLNDISNAYKRIDPEKGVEYGEQGFALAEEINWIKGKVITLSNTGVNYFFMGDYFAAIPMLLQSLDYAEEIQHTRAIAQNAIVLGLSYERTNQNEPALKYYLRSIEPYKKTNITAAATAMKNAANIYINLENYPGALAMATELYEYSTENGLESRQADAYVVRGRAYLALSNYPLAQQNFFKAISIFEKYDMRRRMSDGYLSIGVVFQTLEEYEKALEYYNKALVISEELGEKETNALILSDIGSVYHFREQYQEARAYYEQALEIYEQYENHENIDMTVYNIGGIYLSENDYANALVWFERALKAARETGDEFQAGVILGLTGGAYYEIGLENDTILLIKHFDGDKRAALTTGLNYTDSAIAILVGLGELRNRAFYLDQKSRIEAELGLYDDALKSYKEYAEINDSLFNIERDRKLVQAEMGYEFGRREDSLNLASTKQQLALQNKIELQALAFEYEAKEAAAKSDREKQELAYEEALKRQKIENEYSQKQARAEALNRQKELERKQAEVLSRAELRRQRNIRNFTLFAAAGLLLFSIIVFRQRNKVKKEKARSEELLLNILPAEIAEELKEKGKADARDFELVTILFTDFKGFTEQSAKLSAIDLVSGINHCFEAFDGIMEKYDVEKIKTIGDAYMSAGGLPVPSEYSVKNTVLAALEMQDFIVQRKANMDAKSLPAFEMRVGIHTGPIVAGIVGVKKFQYDIWGDAVNTAARMESAGEVDKVNISQATYELLKDTTEFRFESRGKIKAKGKGEMEMWFVSMNAA